MTWKAIHPEDCVEYNAFSRRPFEDLSCLLRQTSQDLLTTTTTTCTTTSTDGTCTAAHGTLAGAIAEQVATAGRFVLGKIAAGLAASYRDWEFTLGPQYVSSSAQRQQVLPGKWIALTVAASALIILVGRWNMAGRRPWPVRRWITLWNALWCGVNCWGFVRLLPMVVHNAWHYSLEDNVCAPAASLWSSGTTGLWASLWIYGKVLEVFVESFLVVVLKQPCGLMQWFHNYVYVLVHGWHLVTSEIPGGSAVIAVYYGVVAFMNAYCFILNWFQLPQPSKPTAVLDAVHLVQTLSGVALSVITLQYWKHAIWDPTHMARCSANEKHIRIMSFGWAGGHVLMSALNALYQKMMEIARIELHKERRLKRKQEQRRRSLLQKQLLKQRQRNKGDNQKKVTFEEGKSNSLPQLMEEETDNSSETNHDGTDNQNNNSNNKAPSYHDSDVTQITDNTASTVTKRKNKKKKKKKQSQQDEKEGMQDTSQTSQEQVSQAEPPNEQEAPPAEDGWKSSTSKKKKKKKKNAASEDKQKTE